MISEGLTVLMLRERGEAIAEEQVHTRVDGRRLIMRSFTIVGCHSRSHEWNGVKINHSIRFFRIPKIRRKHEGPDVEALLARRRRAWIAAIRRTNIRNFRYYDVMVASFA